MKSLREMTRDERVAMYARADAEVAKASASMVADFKRRNLPTECIVTDYLRWGRARMHCMLLLRHENPSMKGIMVSRGGDDAKRFFLPNSQSQPRPQTTGRFVLTIVTRFILGKMPADFKGVIPPLAGDEWSDAEREEWKNLAAICRKINYEIDMTPRRKKWTERSTSITAAISPSNAA